MMKWTGVGREAAWGKVFIMAFMVIAVIFAYSTNTFAEDTDFDIQVKDQGGNVKIMKLKVAKDTHEFKEAKVDGIDVEKTKAQFPAPIKHIKEIREIRDGWLIVFGGSTCIPIPDGHGGYYWIGYPPGTKCP